MQVQYFGKKKYLAALIVALFTAPAFAQEGSDTKADLAALRGQVERLMQQIETLSIQQKLAVSKQEELEQTQNRVAKQQELEKNQKLAAGSKPVTGVTTGPVMNRYPGWDVRLFGSFDMYAESQQTGTGMVNRLVSSGNGYTQLGFAASRDIGNDVRAFGDVRLSYQTDNGKTNSTVRVFNTATVGFASDQWGTFQVGRMGSQVGLALSAFRLVRLGTGNFIYNPFTTLTHDNSIRYTSPTVRHMQAFVNMDLGENVNDQRKGRAWSGQLKYDDGKTMALAGIFNSNGPTDIATINDKVSIATYGVTHNFGIVKPFLVLQRSKSNLAPLTLNLNGWYAGVDIPVGPGTLRLETEAVKNKAWKHADAKSANVRYDWLLAPETTLYFTYTRILNDANVYYPIVGTGGFAAVATANTTLSQSFNTSYNGKSPTALAVGVKLDF